MTEKQQPDPKWGEYSAFHDPYVLANFQARPTDVLITTSPKAGTTWMQQILYQLKSGGDTDFDNIDHVVPWLEFPRPGISWQQMLDRFDNMANPRVFKTHCTYPQTPGTDIARIILSSRDPRDCCVSFYHHVMSMTDSAKARTGVSTPTSFDDYFEQWMGFGAWFRNVASWWPHINEPNVLWLRYEDMVTDLSGTINRILEFLGWQVTNQQRDLVLEHCSFKWMKQHDEKFSSDYESGEPMFKPKSFIRKGQIGDHKQLLQPEHERRILEKAKAEIPADCLKFIGVEI